MKPAETQLTSRLRRLGLLTMTLALGGAVMGGPAPPQVRLYRVPGTPGGGPLQALPPLMLPPGPPTLRTPTDRFLVVAPVGIDEGMIVPAPTGIDEGMIFPARLRITGAAPVPALPAR